MPAFLTDDWFTKVAELTAQAGDLNLSPALNALTINLIVTDAAHQIELALASGKLQKGLLEHAKNHFNHGR